jgi:two-component system sensor histidine kinase CpxA
MHRLYWKIFLSFWVALILFAGASILVASIYIEHTREQYNTTDLRARTLGYIREARLVAMTKGEEGLKQWLEEIDRKEAIPHLLVDERGQDLLGRQVPSYLQRRIDRLERGKHRHEQHRYKRWTVTTADGQTYRLMPDFKSVTLGRIIRRPKVIAIPLVIATLVSGLVCFLLARYLTRPIRHLSSATQQYAQGNLDLRVRPLMGRRKDELAELASDFDQMAVRLQTLITSHRQLLSDVSHELRSPLARLQVALGLARQRQGSAPEPELDRIELEAERLNELIGQLLSISRLETLSSTEGFSPVRVDSMIEEIVDNANFEAAEKDCKVEILAAMPAVVRADESLLRSALDNVVRNAVIYTFEGTSVEISLQPDEYRDGWIVITVRDHGPGVPEHMLDKLFEPFVRVAESRDRQSGGYGLGLAIAERAIRLHGGDITAANEEGGGLRLIIRLPVTDS